MAGSICSSTPQTRRCGCQCTQLLWICCVIPFDSKASHIVQYDHRCSGFNMAILIRLSFLLFNSHTSQIAARSQHTFKFYAVSSHVRSQDSEPLKSRINNETGNETQVGCEAVRRALQNCIYVKVSFHFLFFKASARIAGYRHSNHHKISLLQRLNLH